MRWYLGLCCWVVWDGVSGRILLVLVVCLIVVFDVWMLYVASCWRCLGLRVCLLALLLLVLTATLVMRDGR